MIGVAFSLLALKTMDKKVKDGVLTSYSRMVAELNRETTLVNTSTI